MGRELQPESGSNQRCMQILLLKFSAPFVDIEIEGVISLNFTEEEVLPTVAPTHWIKEMSFNPGNLTSSFSSNMNFTGVVVLNHNGSLPHME